MARVNGLTVSTSANDERGNISELVDMLLENLDVGDCVTCSSVENYARSQGKTYNMVAVSTILTYLTEQGHFIIKYKRPMEHVGVVKVFERTNH